MTKPTASTSMDCVSLSPKGLGDSCEKDFLFPVMDIYIFPPQWWMRKVRPERLSDLCEVSQPGRGLRLEPMSLAPAWVPVTDAGCGPPVPPLVPGSQMGCCAGAPTEAGLSQAPGDTGVVRGSALSPGQRGP